MLEEQIEIPPVRLEMIRGTKADLWSASLDLDDYGLDEFSADGRSQTSAAIQLAEGLARALVREATR